MKEEITSMKEEITSINNEITSIQQELSQTTEAVNRLIGFVKKNSDQSINSFHRDFCYVHDYYCLLALVIPKDMLNTVELVPTFLVMCLDYDKTNKNEKDEKALQNKLQLICDKLPGKSFKIIDILKE